MSKSTEDRSIRILDLEQVPQFIIGGAPRSGTTYLAMGLDRHPDVVMAKPLIPEPKVFLGAPKTNDEYLAAYRGYFSEAQSNVKLGEKSSAYFENDDVPDRLHQFFHKYLKTKIKLIFILREPVSRAYSNYLRSRANGFEKLSFLEAIDAEDDRPSPFGPEKSYVRPFAYAARGHYDLFAKRYMELFARDEIHFSLYEDIGQGENNIWPALMRFLEIDPVAENGLDVGVVNSSSAKDEPLPEGMKEELMPRFREHVWRFQDMTGVDVSGWGYR